MNAPFSVVVGLHVAPPRGGVVDLLSHHDHAAASSSSTLCFLHENADDVSAITGVGALPRSSAEPHQHQHQRVSGLPAVSVSTPYVLIEEREGTDNCINTSSNHNHNNNNDRHYSSAGGHDLHAFASDMSSAIADELMKSTAQEVVTAAVGGSGTGKSHLILGPSFSTSSLVGSNSSSNINSTRSIFSATLHRIFSQRPQAVVALSVVQVSDGDPLSAVSALERRTTCIDLLSGLRDTLYPQPLRRHNNNNSSHNSQHQHASSGDNRPSRTSPTGCFMADCADVPATQYVRCRSPAEAERVLAEALSSSASWQPHTTTATGERDDASWLLRPRVGSGSHMLITLLIQPHPHGGVNVWKLWDLAGPVTMTTHVGSQPQRTLEGLRLVSHAAARRGASSKQQQHHPHSNDAALAATVHACRCADLAAQLIHASCAESASLLVLIASLRDDGDMDIVNHTALRVAEGWRSAGAASQARYHAMGLRNGEDDEEEDATARRARRRRENSEAAARVLAHFAVDASRYYCIGGGGGCSQAGSCGSSRHGGDAAVSTARQSQGNAHMHSRSPRHHPDASAAAAAVIRSPSPAEALSIDVTNLDMGTAAPSTVLRDAATTTTRSSNASARDVNVKSTRTTTTLSAAEGAARAAVRCEEEATSRFAFLRRSSQDQRVHSNINNNNISDGSPPHARQRSPHTPPSITRTARPPQPPQQRCLADPVELFGAVENRENIHARFDNTAAAEDDGSASTSVRGVVSQLQALLTTIQAEQHDWLVAQSAALADISDIIQNRSHYNSSSNNDNRPGFSDDSSTGGNETGDRYRVEDTSSSSSEVSRLRLRVQWLEQQLVASHQRAQACQAHSAHLPSTAQLLRLLERLNTVCTTTTAAAIHEDDESHLESNSVTIRPAAVPCSTTTISRHDYDEDVNNNIHNESHSTPPPPAETVFTHGVDAQQVDTDAYDDRSGAEYRPHASAALAPATDSIFLRADASSWRSVRSTPTATPIREATLNVSYDATASNDHAITNTTSSNNNNKHDQLRALLSKAFVRERTPTHGARAAGRDDYHSSLLSGVGCDADGGAAAVLVELTPDRLGADDGDEVFNQSATSMSSYNKSRHIELHNNNNAVVTTSCSHPHAASEAVALTSHCTTTAAMAPTTTLDMVIMEDDNSRPTILPLLQSAIAHLQDCALEAGAGAGAAGGAEERLYSAVEQLQVAAREADKVLRDASGREREYLSNILYS